MLFRLCPKRLDKTLEALAAFDLGARLILQSQWQRDGAAETDEEREGFGSDTDIALA